MKSARNRPRFSNPFVDQICNFLQVANLHHSMGPQSNRNGPRHESDSGEVLTNTIVQFLTDMSLLAFADFQDFAFDSFTPPNFFLKMLICRQEIARSLLDARF